MRVKLYLFRLLQNDCFFVHKLPIKHNDEKYYRVEVDRGDEKRNEQDGIIGKEISKLFVEKQAEGEKSADQPRGKCNC